MEDARPKPRALRFPVLSAARRTVIAVRQVETRSTPLAILSVPLEKRTGRLTLERVPIRASAAVSPPLGVSTGLVPTVRTARSRLAARGGAVECSAQVPRARDDPAVGWGGRPGSRSRRRVLMDAQVEHRARRRRGSLPRARSPGAVRMGRNTAFLNQRPNSEAGQVSRLPLG